jgi:nickel-dependent lactate racemase
LVLDEGLPHLELFLTPILEHLTQARIAPDAITLVCPTDTGQPWVETLPEAFEEVQIEVHNPADRNKLAYLATTKQGRRIYLNRTVIDADQVVVLGRRGYDPVLGYGGGASTFYPALTDQATQRELAAKLATAPPGELASSIRQEAEEVCWLLGAPFLVQVIEGPGESVAQVIGGSLESSREGRKKLDERWKLEIDQPAQVVLAGVSGDPARHGFAVLAQALANAARAAEPGGKIVLLSGAALTLPPAADIIRQSESPVDALENLKRENPPDLTAAWQWASVVERHRVYLLSGLPSDTAEELFTTALDRADQAQKLVREGGCLVLPDADKSLVVIRPEK